MNTHTHSVSSDSRTLADVINETGVSDIAVAGLTLLHQPAVVRHDLALGEVQAHLQGNQHRELQRNQLSSVDTKTLLQLLLVRMRGEGEKKTEEDML